jgi:hypothetical protein
MNDEIEGTTDTESKSGEVRAEGTNELLHSVLHNHAR